MKKHYLGLDLGTNSIGWAITEIENNSSKIKDFGVILFEESKDIKTSKTLTQIARNFRSQRRLKRRKKNRVERLKQFWKKHIDADVELRVNNFQETNNLLLINRHTRDGKKLYFNSIKTRFCGLEEKIDLTKLYLSLVILAKHRGYNNFFEPVDDDDKDLRNKKPGNSGKDKDKKQAITDKEKFEFANNNWEELEKNVQKDPNYEYKYISEIILKNKKFRDENNKEILTFRNKERKKREQLILFRRKDYKEEIEHILKKQAEFFPKIFTEKIIKKLIRIIFFQRFFEEGPSEDKKTFKKRFQGYKFGDEVGICSFYTNETRGYSANFISEIFSIVNLLSELVLFFKSFLLTKEDLKIKKTLYNDLVKNFWNFLIKEEKITTELVETLIRENFEKFFKENNKELSYYFKQKAFKDILKKILKKSEKFYFLKIAKFLRSKIKNNSINDEFLKNEFNSFLDIKKVLNYKENNFWNELGKKLVESWSLPKRRKKLEEFFLKKQILLVSLGKDFEILIQKKFKIVSCSFKYMREAISAFIEKGQEYGKFQAEKNKKKDIKLEKEYSLFCKNPIVFRVINLTSKLVKKILKNNQKDKKYNFAAINIEIIRQLHQSLKDRKSDEQLIKNREKINDEMRKEIKTLRGINSDDSKNRLKLKFWKQQRECCLYCLKSLDDFNYKKEDLFGEKFNDEHIVPGKYISDNSENNRILSCRACNDKKDTLLPVEFIKKEIEEGNFPKSHLKKFQIHVNKITKNKKLKRPQIYKISEIKKENLLKEKITSDDIEQFTNRQLSDTSIIAKTFKTYLEKSLSKRSSSKNKIKINCISGIATNKLRQSLLREEIKLPNHSRKFVINSWGVEKYKLRKMTPFNHALDAIILAHLENFLEIKFFSDVINLIGKNKKRENEINKKEINDLKKELLNSWEELEKVKNFNPAEVAYYKGKFEKFTKEKKEKMNYLYFFKNSKFSDFSKKIENVFPIKLEREDDDVYFCLENKEVNGKIQEVEVKIERDNKEYDNYIKRYKQQKETGNNQIRKKKEIKIKIKEILSEEQYRGKIDYPYIFIKKNQKLNKGFSSSEQVSKYVYKKGDTKKKEKDKYIYLKKYINDDFINTETKKIDIGNNIKIQNITPIYFEKGKLFHVWKGEDKESGNRYLQITNKVNNYKSYWLINEYYGLLINKKTHEYYRIPYLLAKQELDIFFNIKEKLKKYKKESIKEFQKKFPKKKSLLIRSNDVVRCVINGQEKIIIYNPRNYKQIFYKEIGTNAIGKYLLIRKFAESVKEIVNISLLGRITNYKKLDLLKSK